MSSSNRNSSMSFTSKTSIDFISPPITPDQHDGSTINSINLGAPATAHFKEALAKNWASPVQIQAFPPSPPASFDAHSVFLKHSSFNNSDVSSGSKYDSTSTDSSKNSANSATSVSTYINKRKQKNPYRSLPRTVEGSFEMPMFINTLPLTTKTKEAEPLTNQHQPHIISTHPASNYLPFAKKRKYSNSHCIFNSCVTTTDQQPKSSSLVAKKARKNSDAKQIRRRGSNEISRQSLTDTDENHDINVNTGAPDSKTDANNNTNTSTSGTTSADNSHDNSDSSPVISKKSKTEAALVFDTLSADSDLAALFADAEEWIPSVEVFNRRPHVRIHWKGSPLKIKNMPHFEKLHPGEVYIAATLRLTPEQYLKCKWALVLAAKKASKENTLFRKSEAQKVCCIDVNKTSVLWNTFGKLGWLGPKWPQ